MGRTNTGTVLGAAAICAALCGTVGAGEIESALVGKIRYDEMPGWTLATRVERLPDGREKVAVRFTADEARQPPRTAFTLRFPLRDAVGRWHTGAGLGKNLRPVWGCGLTGSLADQAPVVSVFSDSNRNRGLVACSEALRRVHYYMGVVEETTEIEYRAVLFPEPEAPLASYEAEFLLDFRDVFYADAIRDTFAWYAQMPAYRVGDVPAAAFDPLYSFWYSYHQDVFAAPVEAECAEAARFGMKVAILDDGWQTDDHNRGYAFCGDWNVSTNRFPDFAAHVARVQALGLKYMIWYSVPYVGVKSANYARFKGKYLWFHAEHEAGVLDPRFPEVREFLIGKYEAAMRDWGLDGLKLDFIDAMHFQGPDPAVKENYAGRDIKSLPLAVDRLMTDVRARLQTIKKDVLVEFRQPYIGPAIRKYGNMLRACDCPMDPLMNRVRTIDLRLTSGEVAVHADMLEWDAGDTPEGASKQFWSILFSVPQISVRLAEIPASHRAKLKEMLDFWMAHRDTLVKGTLRPMRPDLNYPVVHAEGKGEQVIAVYDAGQVADIDRARGEDVYLVNATDATRLVVREDGAVREVAVRPCSALRLERPGK